MVVVRPVVDEHLAVFGVRSQGADLVTLVGGVETGRYLNETIKS